MATHKPVLFFSQDVTAHEKHYLAELAHESFELCPIAEKAESLTQYLVFENQKLRWYADGDVLSLDWQQKSLLRRTQSNRWRQELLIKATGVQKKNYQTALDITAGMGHDALLLAASGMHVTLVERNDYLSILLKHQVNLTMRKHTEKAQADATQPSLNMCVKQGDSRMLYNEKLLDTADIVYCDPMFPEKKKNALSTKAMQVMKSHVDQVQDEKHLLDTAIYLANHRVVVKRSLKAPPLVSDAYPHLKPTLAFSGKVIRYDVYLIENIKSILTKV